MERRRAPHGIVALLFCAGVLSAEDTAPQMVAGMTRYLERLTRDVRARDLSADALRRAYGIEANEPAPPVTAPAGPRGRVLVLSRAGHAASLRRSGYAAVEQPLFDDKARDRLYRTGFGLGRHPVGIETETALGLLDAMFSAGGGPVGIWADEAGSEIALCAAALDSRVSWLSVQDTPLPYHGRPLHFDVFGLVRDLGPLGPRALIPAAKLRTVAAEAGAPGLPRDPAPIERRLLDSIPALERERMARFDPPATRAALRDALIGVLPAESAPPDPRITPRHGGRGFRAYDVKLRVRPEFDATGVLLLPDPPPAGKAPLIVAQHGLQGRPESLFGQGAGREFDTYRDYAETLVREGFAVYLPQNPYRGDFRHLSRLAHPLGLTLFSLIREQYRAALDWLQSHPAIDPQRIGFYGLSYGGKTALRVPTLDERFRVIVCAGDFNEWVRKLADPALKYSYVYTQEYDVLEWNLARIASHAEMAQLAAPRPFLVERGHRDGVGEDEWVSYEFAKVRRYYDEQGLAGKAEIAYFNGPHRIDGVEALRWFHRYLK